MISVKLQYNKSANNKIGKSISTIKTASCMIKTSTSIVDPTLIFTGVDFATIASINYMTIETFKRSYFIKNIVNTGAGQWEVYAHCDVLESYASQIKSLEGIIQRQANVYNLYLEDDMLPIITTPHIVMKAFPNGFTTSEYVLIVAGK
jgi:hypothetical protein